MQEKRTPPAVELVKRKKALGLVYNVVLAAHGSSSLFVSLSLCRAVHI